jgi:glutathione synthase/RimK-type ligase-like ATP-grasp enzyme
MPPRIAFATSQALEYLTDSDRLAAAALRDLGARVLPAIWTDDTVRWKSFDKVVIRSPWDYFAHQDRFLRWFDTLDRAGIPVENPTAILRWNLDKVYLRELNVPTVATEWVERGGTLDLPALLARRRWSRAVIKPTISAGGHDTWEVGEGNAAEVGARMAPVLGRCGLMVQPFVEQIRTQGEISFLFFRKEFSHAVVKRPTAGEFRVQVEYGGSAEAFAPSPALVAQAERVVRAVKGELLYARVDGVDVGGEFHLMELEVLEPDLFLGHAPGAPERFAKAVLAG